MKNDNPRLTAYRILEKYYPGETNVSQLLKLSVSGSKEIEDKGFVREIVWGVVRYLNTIDYFIDAFLPKKKLKNSVRNILRIGVFQLLYFSHRVPEYAAVNETVEIAKLSDQPEFVSLVNAILRKAQNEKNKFPYPDYEKNKAFYYAVKYSHPEWMVARWLKNLGEEITESHLIANNAYPELTIRTNTLKFPRGQLKNILLQEGVESRETEYSPDGLILSVNPELETLKSFQDGYFVIQDEASQLIAHLLEPVSGDIVLDICSGTGTKSSHLFQIAKGGAKITGIDNSANQLNTAKENMIKLGIDAIEFLNFDARKTDKSIQADKILLDAPCSGLGVIRRKPDIKWNRSEKSIRNYYPALQKELLNSVSKLLKNGGTIVYSTCSTEPEENEDVIHEFLKKNKNFQAEKLKLSHLFGKLTDETGYFLRTFPYKSGIDGFFAAKLKKIL